MNFQSVLESFQKKGYQTLSQIQDALAKAGVHPAKVTCTHPSLDKALNNLAPVAAGAAGAAAGAAAAAVSPAAAPVASAVATQAMMSLAQELIPKIELRFSDMEDRLHQALVCHHEELHQVLASKEATATEPVALPSSPDVPAAPSSSLSAPGGK